MEYAKEHSIEFALRPWWIEYGELTVELTEYFAICSLWGLITGLAIGQRMCL